MSMTIGNVGVGRAFLVARDICGCGWWWSQGVVKDRTVYDFYRPPITHALPPCGSFFTATAAVGVVLSPKFKNTRDHGCCSSRGVVLSRKFKNKQHPGRCRGRGSFFRLNSTIRVITAAAAVEGWFFRVNSKKNNIKAAAAVQYRPDHKKPEIGPSLTFLCWVDGRG